MLGRNLNYPHDRRWKVRRMTKQRSETDSLDKIGVDQECGEKVDRLSQLPDDILISIISGLPLQEITATSILSTRWRRIHTGAPSLNFEFLLDDEQKGELYQIERFQGYNSGINQAIDSYKGHYMHASSALRVFMPCLGHMNLKENIYKWLEFGSLRKVEIIDLCVLPCENYCQCTSLVSDLITRSCKQWLFGVKKLYLSWIYINDREINLILSNFVSLEHLSIDFPEARARKRLKYPSLVGHCKLTHLNLSSVHMSSIEVRNMINLVSLRLNKVRYSTCIVSLDSVPNLVDFTYTEVPLKNTLPEIIPKISCIHHQLLHLELSIFLKEIDRFTCPKLTNLKHMELKVILKEGVDSDEKNTDQLFSLIEACPSLEKLEIQFLWYYDQIYIHRAVNESRIKGKEPNYNLKKVSLLGYFGSVFELELATYLMNNAVSLQQLVVKAYDRTPEIRGGAISRASLISSQFNSHVKLVIL